MDTERRSLLDRSFYLKCIAVFFACAFLLYGTSLNNNFVQWDDGLLIYENPAIREISIDTLRTIFTTYDPELYIPLTLFSYQLNYFVSGTHPFIYHQIGRAHV